METHFDNLRPAHARPEGQRVITDLKSLVRESEDFLRATVGDVNEKTRETRSRLAAALERAKTTAKHWQEQAAAPSQGTGKTPPKHGGRKTPPQPPKPRQDRPTPPSARIPMSPSASLSALGC